jgi:hypothetical protein
MTKTIELKEFARRVEHVCDFFLSKTYGDGSDDRKVLEDLKEDAANIQFGQVKIEEERISGLSDYVRGISESPEENIGKES